MSENHRSSAGRCASAPGENVAVLRPGAEETSPLMTPRSITPNDVEWPEGLQEMRGIEPPEQLYLTGLPIPPLNKSIAVVGTRRPTGSGAIAARQIARALAQAGYVVVSGLAVGIDAIAHKAALDAGGTTVAVLGAGLDQAYPQKNARLRREIECRGTVVTEYSMGTAPHAGNFPERNRIIAGLSSAVVVIEGTSRSGALITARLAFDMAREVFAVPGSIRNSLAEGPNELIRTSIARMITDVQHIFDELAPGSVWAEHLGVSRVDGKPALSDEESAVLATFDDSPLGTAGVTRLCALPEGQVKLILARLEVRGLVVRRRRGWELTDVGARIRAMAQSADEEGEGPGDALIRDKLARKEEGGRASGDVQGTAQAQPDGDGRPLTLL